MSEKDLALEQLEIVVREGGIRRAETDPEWDALRSHPHFEKIVASLAPKD